MSKDEEANNPPPPYTESAYRDGDFVSLSGAIAAQLRELPARLRAAHDARTARLALDDLAVVELVAPRVAGFLGGGVAARRAELILVPAAAVPAAWALAEDGRGRNLRVERVAAVDAKDARDKNPEVAVGGLRPGRDWSSTQFDEWGRWDDGAGAPDDHGRRGWWWWHDEPMARRLAALLQPEPPVQTERCAVQAAVVQAKEDKKKTSWGWGKSRASGSGSSTLQNPAAASTSSTHKSLPTVQSDGRAKMTVEADEVTFRKENEFGVWESMSGWGLVVTVTIDETS